MQTHDLERPKAAGVFSGYVYPLSIFVSEAGSPWPRETKLALLSKTRTSENWLCQQAAMYDVFLSFHPGGNFGLDVDLVVPSIPMCTGQAGQRDDWIPTLLQQVGWQSPSLLHQHILSETGCDSVYVTISANKAGRCYAMPLAGEPREDPHRLDWCFVYRWYMAGHEVAPSSIAHEVMHLYGAWDLYCTWRVSMEQEQKARELFPDDIMHRNALNIEELIVDAVTAWRIGWTPKMYDWYEWFQPHFP